MPRKIGFHNSAQYHWYRYQRSDYPPDSKANRHLPAKENFCFHSLGGTVRVRSDVYFALILKVESAEKISNMANYLGNRGFIVYNTRCRAKKIARISLSMLMTSRPLSANSRTVSLLTRSDAPVITATLISPLYRMADRFTWCWSA